MSKAALELNDIVDLLSGLVWWWRSNDEITESAFEEDESYLFSHFWRTSVYSTAQQQLLVQCGVFLTHTTLCVAKDNPAYAFRLVSVREEWSLIAG